ncbi:MAG TPA: AsnC family protein [Pseudonocardiaceae bacterium]|nr:AsnC family protein [Pseudonocardiaceae bacterium]
MVTPDPVDVRLLALVAEVGRVAVHDLAARAGMDAREVAARLAALAAMGLPLVVGVECDQAALRYALARPGWPAQPGPPHGPMPPAAHRQGPQGGPAYHGPTGQQAGHVPAGPPHPGHVPAGPHPAGHGPTGTHHVSTGQHGAPAASRIDPVGTWGPPQVASWARGDQDVAGTSGTVRTAPAGPPEPGRRTGAVGDVLHGKVSEDERVSIHLVEVVDPADFLFTAAGYRLQPGERSVVVHTELTNRGSVPLSMPPDQHLVLVDAGGAEVSKAPVSLSSRPPHRSGLRPGETAGGHTVYVLAEGTELASVRWSPRPGGGDDALTWMLRD